MPVAAVDFETYYDKNVSITVQGVWHYLRDPLCDIYLVSIVTDTGLRWVGHPKDAPWNEISGPEWTWVSHNAAFDEEVMIRLRELYDLPFAPGVWECTADLAAYIGAPRSLAGACEWLFKIELSKDVRDRMKGKRWDRMSEEFQHEVKDYALTDSVKCLDLWVKHSPEWPDWERRLSRLTRKMGRRGVKVDVPLVEKYIGDLSRMIWEANKDIPWADTHPALSYKKLCDECRKHNIRPPVSTAIDSEDCAAWEEQYGDQYPWVGAMRQKRRANTLLKRFQTLKSRVQPNGRASLPLKYCGASTRRWSGSAGFNAQNMSREELLGTEARKCIIAPPGRKLVVADLAQIECRVLAKMAGDLEKLELMRIYDPYEAYARKSLGYDRPEKLADLKHIPEFDIMRRTAKGAELGLGYQCGASRYQEAAWQLAKLRLTAKEAEQHVESYRANNPKIKKLWKKMHRALESSIGSDLVIVLPSGNKLVYHKIAIRGDEYTGLVSKGGRMSRVKLYGGKLVENICQAVARDIFATQLLAMDADGLELVLQTHDEAVIEADDDMPDEKVAVYMTVSPSWMLDIPLATSVASAKYYEK